LNSFLTSIESRLELSVAAVDTVDNYIQALPGQTRRLADAEWGITVDADNQTKQPIDVGIRVNEGLLTAQAFAISNDQVQNPWVFLHWNRQTRLVRFACTRAGDIWVHLEVPAGSVDERTLDRALGLLVEAALAARYHQP
jgi:hypothetical protein